MSDAPEARAALPPRDVAQPAAPAPAPRSRLAPLAALFRTAFTGSILLNSALVNVVLLLVLFALVVGDGSGALRVRYHSGSRTAKDKIALMHIEGILWEGLMDYAHRQIEQAAEDKSVKAVVLRINTPGGTVTASDELHRRLEKLRDGDPAKHRDGKQLVVSMGGWATSGGYYIAMPAKHVIAEPTTTTGSVGVYAAFPNVAEFAEKNGITMTIIKRGTVKGGSIFHKMTAEERQVWQDMIDHAYQRFIAVVEQGRPDLKGKLEEVVIDKPILARDGRGNLKLDATGQPIMEKEKYIRRRADGGIFTADDAKKLGLIDQIGYVEDAVQEAKKLAGLGEDYQVITYERPQSLLKSLVGLEAARPSLLQLRPDKLAAGAAPRLWYLAPQSELAGWLAAMRENEE